MYSEEVWNQQVETALKGNILDENIADLNVKFRSGKVEVPMDEKQGRVNIPQHLLDYAGIEKELVAIRAGQYWRIVPKP